MWYAKIVVLLVLIVDNDVQVGGDHYQECNSPHALNNFVASQTSCSHYIYCDGENSFMGECLDSNYFSESAGSCIDAQLVECKLSLQHDDGDDMNEGSNSSNGIRDNSTPIGVHQSLDAGVTVRTTAPSITTYGIQSRPPSDFSTHHPSKLLTAASPAGSTPACVANTALYLAHPHICSAYYICHRSGIPIPMSCPPQHSFNACSGKCERQELVDCALNRPARVYCVKGIYTPIPHPDNCEYYYICSDGFLMVSRCPVDLRWDFKRRSCLHKSIAKCYTSQTAISR